MVDRSAIESAGACIGSSGQGFGSGGRWVSDPRLVAAFSAFRPAVASDLLFIWARRVSMMRTAGEVDSTYARIRRR
jgi:hypothetical protein